MIQQQGMFIEISQQAQVGEKPIANQTKSAVSAQGALSIQANLQLHMDKTSTDVTTLFGWGTANTEVTVVTEIASPCNSITMIVKSVKLRQGAGDASNVTVDIMLVQVP